MNNSFRNESSEFEYSKPSNRCKFNLVGSKHEDSECAPDVRQALKNALLAALPPENLDWLMPHLKFEYVSFEMCLFNYGEKVDHVYFPTTAVIALLHLLADGNTSEIAVVGHDGLLGISFLMDETALGSAMVQSSGYVYKIPVHVFKEACDRDCRVQRVIMRYLQRFIGQVAQNSTCCRHYSIDQQLSYWLLNRLDLLTGNELKMTQATIARMLGVRRESITSAAHRLQQEGLIQHRRGSITVLNRRGLEEYAGECYQETKLSGAT